MNNDWKSEYFKILSKNNLTTDDVKSSINLKIENIPDQLFKYCKYNENDESNFDLTNLLNNQIHLASPSIFNDPFDSLFSINPFEFKVKNNSKVNIAQNVIKFFNHFQKLKEINDRQLDNYNLYFNGINRNILTVSCFCERVDSVLMWSHYANKHEGFCIEYNFRKMSNDDQRKIFLYPINYVETIPNLNSYFNNTESKNILSFTFAAITKAVDWKYEQEWRIVYDFNLENKSGCITMIKPEAIYLGSRTNNNKLIEKLQKFCRVNKIKLYKMSMMKDEFKMIPQIVK